MLSRRDWLLLAVAAAVRPMTPVQVQKAMFLLGQRHKAAVGEHYYSFRPYNYGPFSSEIYQDAAALANAGLLLVDSAQPGRAWALYTASPSGMRRSRDLEADAPREAVEYLRRAVVWAQSLSFNELVSAIYRDFPEQRKNSVFVDR